MPLGNLGTRALTGAVFATVVIGSILWNPYAQALVFSVFYGSWFDGILPLV